jgi:hypothetical protein
MPVVRMPDGANVAFPNDMPPEQIKAMILRKFPDAGKPKPINMSVTDRFATKQKTPPPGPGPMDYLTQGMSGLNEGIAAGIGAPVDIASMLINAGTTGVNALTGSQIPQITNPIGGSQRIREGILAPTIQPQTDDPSLRATRRVAQEVGAWAVPGVGMAAKTATPIRAAVKDLPAVFGSGAGAATAQALAPGNPLAEFAGQMIGGLTPGAVSRTTSKGPKAPSIDELRVSRDKAYDAAKQFGASYAPKAYDDMLVDLVKDVKADGISPTRHDRAYSFITDMIQRRNGKPMTLTELDQLRQEVRRDLITPSYANPNAAADAHFGDKILDAIDELIATDPGGSKTMAMAREAHSRLRKSELIADAIERARRRTESTGSGGNINNAIRQNITAILNSPKKSKAFTKAEKAAMEDLIKQGKMENLLRFLGKFSPSGNGLSAWFGIGAASQGMGIIPAVGLVAKGLADTATTRKAANLQNRIAGGPIPNPPILPGPAVIYGQAANQSGRPVEITVRGGAR